MRTKTLRQLLGLVGALAVASAAWGYSYITQDDGFPVKWYASTITMQIKVDNSTHLADGTTRATSIQAAMLDPQRGWNHYLGTVQFVPQIQAAGSGTNQDSANQIFFAATPYTYTWDSNTLAVTTEWYSGDQREEADIIFNTAFTWDSYRGALRANGVVDIQRVVLHELGHVLGLDHPDEHGQSVSALMNSVISDLDSLQADDIAGAQSLYGVPGVVPPNDNFVNAVLITLNNGSAQVSGTNIAATKEAGEPNHAGDTGGHSVWWKWVAPANGGITVDTSGSNFDTTLGIYTGASVSALSLIAANDDIQNGVVHTSSVSVLVTGGTTYYFAVDGFGGDSGSIVLETGFFQPSAPSFTNISGSVTVDVGVGASFAITASGSPAPAFQWQRLPAAGGAWANLTENGAYSGTDGSILNIASTFFVMNGDQFRCIATNVAGTATSSTMTLTVRPAVAPTISNMPATVTVAYNGFLNINPTVTGTPNITYKWRKDGASLLNGDDSNYSKSNVTTADSGNYTLTATNSVGSATATAAVTVSPPAAPVISGLPASLTLGYGDNLYLAPDVTGSPPITFQWKKDGVAIPGATNSSYSNNAVTTADSGQYTLTATNPAGSTTSAAVAITVNPPGAPEIFGLPATVTVGYGGDLELSPEISGSQPMTFQWSKDGTILANATNSYYIISSATAADGGSYVLKATNPAGTGTSSAVTVIVSPPVAPNIFGLPATVSLTAADTLYLSADVSGTLPVTLQWKKNGVAISNATSTVLIINSTTLADGGQYTLTATNVAGSMTSAPVVVTVYAQVAPTITQQPVSVRVLKNAQTHFNVSATGSGILSYQWYFNGQAIPGATAANFYVPSAAARNIGNYTVTVTNNVSSVTSNVVTLSLMSVAGDFNSDGAADLIVQNTATGERDILFLSFFANYASTGGTSLGVLSNDWAFAASADFNGDGAADFLWQNTVTGERAIWLMNGTYFISGVSLGVVPLAWSIVGAGDFNGDGQPDIVWQNSVTGERSVWVMNGTTFVTGASLGVIPLDWTIAAIADFDADGQPDILWSNTRTGELSVWLMNGTNFVSGVSLGVLPPQMQVDGAGVYNGDGKAEILFTNTLTGERSIWKMNGTTHTDTISIGILSLQWVLDRPAPWNATVSVNGDFNGDGKADILWQNTVTGERSIWLMNGGTFQSGVSLGVIPLEWSIAAHGDFNSDGKTDILWQNTATGECAIWLMDGGSFLSGVSLGVVPTDWSIVGAGDFNGDGKPDIFWQNTVTGERCIWAMDGTSFLAGVSLGLIPTDWSVAAIADLNGNGKPDILWQNTVTGERAIWIMNGTNYVSGVSMGIVPTDWTVAGTGDFNSDWKTDLIWQNTVTGERAIWLMNGPVYSSGVTIGVIPVEWSIRN